MSAADSQIPVDVQNNQTYAHRLARVFVRPLLGTRVRPNHITGLRLIVGVVACACLAVGVARADFWAGLLWTVACVMDRADGELARLGDLRSESGRMLDFYSDLILDSLWFLASGIGARHGTLGSAAIVLGALVCAAIFLCNWVAELFEQRSAPGVKAYYGLKRFHPDDALFLLPVILWLGWQEPMLVAASVVTVAMALTLLVRYWHLRHSQVPQS